MKVKLKYSVSKNTNTMGYHKYTVYVYDDNINKWKKTKHSICYYGSNSTFAPLYSFLLNYYNLKALYNDYYFYCTIHEIKKLLKTNNINIIEYNKEHKNNYYFKINKI